MKILLIGSGGREHAIAKKLAQSPQLTQLWIAPGNPGTAQIGTNVAIPVTDLDGLVAFAVQEKVDLVVVGPEDPLVAGLADLFTAQNIPVVGPSKAAAQLEGSKKWTKALMAKYHIPTAAYQDFTSFEPALDYIQTRNQFPIVIKADGLAAGKGVTIAQDLAEAQQALEGCFIHQNFGQAGATVVIEDFLQGEEASILAFCDGTTILPMLPAQDHKAIYDGDKGPNTGGMGAYCPAPIADPTIQQKVLDRVLKPLVAALNAEGTPFKGIVFAGLMIQRGEPSVVEFNARFGDPETQVVLALLKTDLIDIFNAITTGTLDQIKLEWAHGYAVCVILAAGGYPGAYAKGDVISGAADSEKFDMIHSGTTLKNGALVTNGGRVLGVVAKNPDLASAIHDAYLGVNKVQFSGKTFRTDIASKALA